jgi:colanic acid biosynthesis protein WcaH
MINTSKFDYGDDYDYNEESGLIKHPPEIEHIEDEMYNVILEKMPIFCVDWLISCKGKFLLLKRTQQPLKGDYWLIGGRLQKNETIDEAGYRLQGREIGRYCGKGTPIGFSNYFFPVLADSRATHTPAVSFLVEVEEEFVPILDDTEDEYIWTDKLPLEYANQTSFFPNPPLYGGTI